MALGGPCKSIEDGNQPGGAPRVRASSFGPETVGLKRVRAAAQSFWHPVWSAGGNCWFEDSVTDSFGPLRGLGDGLGFLTGSFCPHYDGELERGFAYDDPDVGIKWPVAELVVSQRDRSAPRLAEIAARLPFAYGD